MAGTSQNGWRAGSRAEADVATFVVPGYPNVKVAVNRLAAPALLAMLRWMFDHVEKPVIPGVWGWAVRPIRGSSETSNHASGTAVDWNAPRHPLGAVGTVPARLRAAIAAQAAKLGLRWGGTYTGRKDEMHFEAIVTPARMRQIVAALQGRPAPKPPGGGGTPGARPVIRRGSDYPNYVRDVQRRLKESYPLYAGHLAVDGEFGSATEKAVREFQRRAGLPVDGIVGRRTWVALGF